MKILLLNSIASHSWLDCVDSQENGECKGFIRGYQGHLDLIETYQILNRENKPICDPRYQIHPDNYSQQYPRARAKPGLSLKLKYTENGHVTKDVLEYGRPNPKKYSLHWTKKPYFGNLDSQLLMRAELGPQNQLGESYTFDDGKCAEDNTKGRQGPLPCYGTFTIPQGTEPGIYQFIWWWKFDKDPKGMGEEYTSCFDVEVLKSDGNSCFQPMGTEAMPGNNTYFPYMEDPQSKTLKAEAMFEEYKNRAKDYNRSMKSRKTRSQRKISKVKKNGAQTFVMY